MDEVLRFMDMRSFSSLWYWMFLAVMWSMVSHRPLGVPFDLIGRARRDAVARADVITLVGIGVRRVQGFASDGAGFVAAAFGMFGCIAVLGFGYGYEFCQALALILGPMLGVAMLSLRTVHRLAPMLPGQADPAGVIRVLLRHRRGVQILGIVSITLSAFWGGAHTVTFVN